MNPTDSTRSRTLPPWGGLILFLGLLAFALLYLWPVTFSGEGTFYWSYDNSIQTYPWLNHLVRAWRSGEPPLWDFSTYSGTTFTGEVQTSAFYPLHSLLILLSPLGPDGRIPMSALEIYQALHFALAAFFMVWLLKRAGFGLLPALLGGIFFAFTGTFARKASGQSNLFWGMAYLPAAPACLLAYLERPRPPWRDPWLYAGGLALAMPILAGHIVPTVFASTVLAAFALLAGKKPGVPHIPVRSLSLCVLFGSALLFAAPQLLPALEYLPHALRWVGGNEPIMGLKKVPYSVYAYHEVLDPSQLAGILRPGIDLKDGASLFLTYPALALAVLGAFSRKKFAKTALFLAFFAVLIALGGHTPLGRLFYAFPGIGQVREPVRALLLFHFSMAFLAGAGASRLLDLLGRKGARWAGLGGVILLGATVLTLFPQRQYCYGPRTTAYYPDRFYDRTPVVDFLAKQSLKENFAYRVVNERDVLPPNMGNVFPLHTTFGHRATVYAPYMAFLARDWSYTGGNWDFLAAKYIVSKKELPGFPVVFRGGDLKVYRRHHPFPVFQLLSFSGKRASAPVKKIRWSCNSVECQLARPVKGFLVFSQLPYPGWKVRVDGEERSLTEKDGLIAVNLRGRGRKVEFFYRPLSVTAGFLLFLAGLGALAASAFLSWRERPAPRRRGPGAWA